ncbi:MAG: hypothetical protein FWC57_00950 [Endomicrobia bacterium]|nr:hypothetical protein [Endomicrobiia bacterium]
MHDSHKFWIMIAIFLVVMGLLVGMFLTATPDKMKSVVEKQKKQQTTEQTNNGN